MACASNTSQVPHQVTKAESRPANMLWLINLQHAPGHKSQWPVAEAPVWPLCQAYSSQVEQPLGQMPVATKEIEKPRIDAEICASPVQLCGAVLHSKRKATAQVGHGALYCTTYKGRAHNSQYIWESDLTSKATSLCPKAAK